TDYVEHTRLGAPLYEALATILSDFSYPICFNFPIGHVQDNRPMINGALCNLQINKKSVSLSFDNQE
ncbi:MAG TPA: LD-carboxypeptidase, partial [Bacteroidaceae bacterium]|nr:LD-carboxypeptidase [Bacteroidaceae bacterium]